MQKGKKQHSTAYRAFAVLLSVIILLLSLGVGATASSEEANIIYSNGYKIEKITNPTKGEGDVDGIIQGGDRNNCYAWAMTERDGFLYIGTNRNILGGMIAQFAQAMTQAGLTYDQVWDIVNVITNGEVPAFSAQESRPMIIRVNPATSETKVIYEAPLGTDSAYRMVVKHHNELYFGSMSSSSGTRIVKVDENDNAEIVYSGGGNSSFRAGTVYNDKLYFGGLDNRIPDETAGKYNKIAILEKNPKDDSDWQRVADFNDFIDYADDTLYQGEGGTVWDLIPYQGDMYVFLATSNGFVLFKGHEASAGENANQYGWTWQEVIGKNSQYHMGMAPTAEGYNTEDGATPGLIASAATPVVFQDKLYFGTFDYALRAELVAVQGLLQMIAGGENAPALKDFLKPMYDSLNAPQKMYCMDQNGKITAVDQINQAFEGTTNEYFWRYGVYNDQLFVSSFDASSLYKYVTKLTNGDLLRMDKAEFMQQINYIVKLLQSLTGSSVSKEASALTTALTAAQSQIASLLDKQATPENVQKLIALVETLVSPLSNAAKTFSALPASAARGASLSGILDALKSLAAAFDLDGLRMYFSISNKLLKNEPGFDLYVTKDGENYTELTLNGFHDKFNFGGRTLVANEDGLYIGTANPFYGAQVWRITEVEEDAPNSIVEFFAKIVRFFQTIIEWFRGLFQ